MKETNKNNFELKVKVNFKNTPMRLRSKLIRLMLKTIVPIGYSYVDNADLNEGVIRFNKSVPKGITRVSLEEEAVAALVQDSWVESVEVVASELCPVELQEMSYHCPISYVNKNVMVEA